MVGDAPLVPVGRMSQEEDGMIANSLRVRPKRFGLTAVGAVAFATLSLSAQAATEGGGGGLPQLDISTFPTQIFWLIVTFAVLYVIMSKIAVPRIADVLEERQERIEDDIETADRLREEAEKVKAEYEAAVADARAKAHDLVKKAMDEIAEANAKAETAAAKKTAETTKAAEDRITAQKQEALSSLKAVAAESAAEATRKLTGIEVAGAKVDAAVDNAMQGGV